MNFQFLESIAHYLVNGLLSYLSLGLTLLFFCLLVFHLSSPTSSFSINTKIIETWNMTKLWVLLLGDKGKGNKDLGWFWVTRTQNYCWYSSSLHWDENSGFLEPRDYMAMAYLGTFSFSHFWKYNFFKWFYCRLFCHIWEKNLSFINLSIKNLLHHDNLSSILPHNIPAR